MRALGFQLIFASTAPFSKKNRSRQYAVVVQNKWDARKQRRVLVHELNPSIACKNLKKI